MQDGDMKDVLPAEEASETERAEEQLWDEFTKSPQDDAQNDAQDLGEDVSESPDESPSEDEDDPKDAGDATKDDPATLQEQVERLQHKLDSEQGRTAKLRRDIERLQGQIASAQEAPRDRADDTSGESRQELESRLKQAREDYPDVIGPLAEKIESMERRFDQLSQREIADLESQREQYDALVAEEEGLFLSEHPDGFDVVTEHREIFREWIEDQPKRLRDIYAANTDLITDGTAAAYLVSKFKQSLLGADGDVPSPASKSASRLDTRRQRQLDGARSTRTGNRSAKTGDIPSDADPEALFDYFIRKDEEKDRRRAER